MPLWRCTNPRCSVGRRRPEFNFESGASRCPKCGASWADPETKDLIQRLVTIHYDPPHPIREGRGKNHLACDPSRPSTGPNVVSSGDPVAVNCPRCRQTQVYLDNKPEGDPRLVEDVLVNVNENGTVTLEGTGCCG